jgi:hypothetical protein
MKLNASFRVAFSQFSCPVNLLIKEDKGKLQLLNGFCVLEDACVSLGYNGYYLPFYQDMNFSKLRFVIQLYMARDKGREFLALRGARPSYLNRPQALYDL